MNGLYEQVEAAAEYVRGRIGELPTIGVVLGSGLGSIADRAEGANVVSYAEIPGFPTPSVHGHAGRLVCGKLGGRMVAVLQGRSHFYEGRALAQVTLPTRVLARIGIRTLILTAAAGGINESLRVGQIVWIRDHINLLGDNPLRGVDDERLGPRFTDLSAVYSPRLRDLAHREAVRLGTALGEGVYAAMIGPSYETPAEIRMLRTLGADLVGMSVVPEAIVARQCGIEVLGLATITNAAAGLSDAPINHQEVLVEGRAVEARLGALIEAVIAALPDRPE